MPEVQYKLIEDGAQFVVFAVGWHEKEYVHDLWFHVEIIEDKIWIFENNTDYQLSEALVVRGVEKEDIVVAWLRRNSEVAAVSVAV